MLHVFLLLSAFYAFSKAKWAMTHEGFLFHFSVISASNCRINQLLPSSVPTAAYHSVLLEVAANYFLTVFWIVGVLQAGLSCLQETGPVDIASGFL